MRKKNTIFAMFSFRNRLRVLLLNIPAIGFHSTSKNGCTVFTRRQSREDCVGLFRYSDRLSRNLQFGVAKNVRDVLGQWTPRKKYVKYQTFPTRFGYIVTSGIFWRNFTKLCRICIPFKFGQN